MIGRFTQQDPLDQVADLRQGNRYLYAGNDPVNFVDPSGQAVPALVAIYAFGGRAALIYAKRHGTRAATRVAVRGHSSTLGQLRSQFSYQYGDKGSAIVDAAKRAIDAIF